MSTNSYVVLQSDTPNINGLVYTHESLLKAIDEYNARDKKLNLGITTNTGPTSDYGIVNSLSMVGNKVVANIEFSENNCIQEVLESGKFVVRPVSEGDLTSTPNVFDIHKFERFDVYDKNSVISYDKT